ncbi:MAG TPA: hypothetical protein VNN19_08660 [bacterium]|nr:hypothetical protein [bacterium]
MFLGHYAVALGAKRAAPTISLGALILAAQWTDLLWPVLLLLGVERVAVQPGATALSPLDFQHYPITHSLLGVALWGALFAVLGARRARAARPGVILGLVVVSHWVLDLLVHRPDLPIVPGGVRLGLGLWNVPPVAVILEGGLFVLGLVIYLRATRPTDRIGSAALWTFALGLALVYAVSLLGPAPRDSAAIAAAALAAWLFVPWGYWIDRHRRAA